MKLNLLFAALALSGSLAAQDIDLELYRTGFEAPTDIAFDPDGRMYIVEQGGYIRLMADNDGDDDPDLNTFLNISGLVDTESNEGGLLGLAFHPDYETNGYFYLNYTNTSGNTVIARYSVSSSENQADAGSASIVLTVDQPYANHNGGCLKFGPDGYLYIGMGDGGSGGDPQNRAQNINTLLGKMLRIDVDNGMPYSSPAGNPYLGVAGADEIWAIGLRNPWKFSFNRINGELWIADVGQEVREEINSAAQGAAGLNYGWRCYEGLAEYDMSECSGITGFTQPVAQYTHNGTGGCSITGGYVYTGSEFPLLLGKYVFADFCNNRIGVLDSSNTITWSTTFGGNNFTTFGESPDGDLYVAGRTSGTVYKIIDASAAGRESFAGGSFAVYPNPAADLVFVELNDIDNPVAMSILDIRGKVVLEQDLAPGESRIDTASLGTGMYLMRLESSGMVKHHKLVVK
ncbi:PQQ-dependent sugar dehydrogenase [Flavobacterium sp. MFBS3-15]|uniref:PQQ-dependent sugar dehydrogenase n=1 Tax=Flavobacterium sp. MFBS3-15 TaxID=2989816 RepID=UPI0022365309|nr:PQQ-dependent sugar dehydrogenase [Flavobacterium sp. MFBS3-15]MCW4470337.1 PQQ-dependent sugar dehydrogenase [Flavobacterium sp. MFBS3-15]